MKNKNNACSFIGHRYVKETETLRSRIYAVIEELIQQGGVVTFFFGSKSKFNSLCYEITTELKEKYPHILRIYVRAEFPIISDDYEAYLLELYEETYYPQEIKNAGKAVYIERNRVMIDKSAVCVVYCGADSGTGGGTKRAYKYAQKKARRIINVWE